MPAISLTDPKNGTLTDAQVIEANNTILENLLNGQLDQSNISPAIGAAVPTGSVVSFAGPAAPTGWLVCDGSAVDRSLYATLFAVIGTTYGAGNGSTTFNLPNLTDRMPVGRSGSKALGSVGGTAQETLTLAQVPAHGHITGQWSNARPAGGTGGNTLAPQGQGDAGGVPVTDTVGGGQSHNNVPPYQALNFIIKA
jgi:microcystin-dependent protein